MSKPSFEVEHQRSDGDPEGGVKTALTIHQRMYCLMCGADPDTFEGGDPKIAYHVIRNSQNIAKHYWSANIEPYLPTRRRALPLPTPF